MPPLLHDDSNDDDAAAARRETRADVYQLFRRVRLSSAPRASHGRHSRPGWPQPAFVPPCQPADIILLRFAQTTPSRHHASITTRSIVTSLTVQMWGFDLIMFISERDFATSFRADDDYLRQHDFTSHALSIMRLLATLR